MSESYTRVGTIKKIFSSKNGRFFDIETKKPDGTTANNKFSYFDKEGETPIDLWEGAEIDFTFYIKVTNGVDYFNITKINSVSGDKPEPKQEFKPNYGGQNKFQSKFPQKTYMPSTKDSKLETEGRLLNTIIMEVFKAVTITPETHENIITDKIFSVVEPLYKKCAGLLNEKSVIKESQIEDKPKIKDIPEKTNEINF